MIETVAPPPAGGAVGGTAIGPVLELAGVGHEYGSGTPWAKAALRNVDLQIREGDGVLIHGGNGSGKSTLAWIMAGLTPPTEGSCLLDGRPVADQVGAVAISFRLPAYSSCGAPWITRSRPPPVSPSNTGRVGSALADVGLDAELAQRRVDQLSGGQMRRVVLAGLLSRLPRVLILDEPLAGLDAASQRGLGTATPRIAICRADCDRHLARLSQGWTSCTASVASARRHCNP